MDSLLTSRTIVRLDADVKPFTVPLEHYVNQLAWLTVNWHLNQSPIYSLRININEMAKTLNLALLSDNFNPTNLG